MDEVVKQAEKMAAHSTPIVMMAKEAVNKAYELNLKEGLDYERRLFHQTFATVSASPLVSGFVLGPWPPRAVPGPQLLPVRRPWRYGGGDRPSSPRRTRGTGSRAAPLL